MAPLPPPLGNYRFPPQARRPVARGKKWIIPFFLMSGVNGNLDTNGLEVSCKLLESRRSEAQELLDQAKKMNNQ